MQNEIKGKYHCIEAPLSFETRCDEFYKYVVPKVTLLTQ